MQRIAARFLPEKVFTPEELEDRESAVPDSPELQGLDVPLTTDERLELDAQLGLQEPVHVPA